MLEEKDPRAPRRDDPPAVQTTFHVRHAARGDQASQDWLVARLSPLLIVHAAIRLPAALRRHVDPEDVVQEVWKVALPKLDHLEPRDGRYTPVLLQYLGTVLVYTVNNFMRRHIKDKLAIQPLEPESTTSGGGVVAPEAPVTDPGLRAARKEATCILLDALRSLAPDDQRILVLRFLESGPFDEIANELGINPKAAQMRCSRALERLRRALPGSVFDELDE